MTKLQSLSMFLKERLMLAAQDIYKAVEVTVTEYHDEISRSRQENELLKRRLLDAGIELYLESQPGPSVSHGETSIGSDRRASDKEMLVKREICVPMQETEVLQHQAPISEEPVSPSQCLETERRMEELFRVPTTENGTNALLHTQQCMQIKEEISESKFGLKTEVFESHSCSSNYPSSSVATGHATGLDNELDRISSMHKDLEHPLTSKLEFVWSNQAADCDRGVQDKELAQKRERISKPTKVGKKRKMELRMENSSACSKKQSLPDVLLLDEEQSLPTHEETSPPPEKRGRMETHEWMTEAAKDGTVWREEQIGRPLHHSPIECHATDGEPTALARRKQQPPTPDTGKRALCQVKCCCKNNHATKRCVYCNKFTCGKCRKEMLWQCQVCSDNL